MIKPRKVKIKRNPLLKSWENLSEIDDLDNQKVIVNLITSKLDIKIEGKLKIIINSWRSNNKNQYSVTDGKSYVIFTKDNIQSIHSNGNVNTIIFIKPEKV